MGYKPTRPARPLTARCASRVALGFLQSERQLGIAIAEYTCLSDRGKINYEDFCDTLDASEKARHAEFGHGFGSTAKTIGFVDASGYDGMRGRTSRTEFVSYALHLWSVYV